MASPLHVGALALSVAVSLVVAAAAVRYRDRPGGWPLVVLMTGAAVWATATLAQLLVGGSAAQLWNRLLHAGSLAVVTGYVVFALAFGGYGDRLTVRTLAALSVEPAAVLVLAWTNLGGERLWRTTVDGGAVDAVGPAVTAHVGYSYVLVGVATALLVRAGVDARRQYQGQFVAIAVGVFAPWVGNAVYQLGLVSVDPTPMAFSVTGVALCVGMARFEFMNVVPVAREAVVDNIDDAMLVVDEQNRVLDVNPAFRELFGTDGEIVGRPVRSALAGYPTVREQVTDGSGEPDGGSVVVTADTPTGERHLRVSTSVIGQRGRGRSRGRLYLLYDVTAQRRREQRLRRSERRYRALAEKLPARLVTLFDSELEFTLVSGRAIEGMKDSAEGFEGESLSDVFDDDYVDRYRGHYRAVFDGEESTFEFHHADRTYRTHLVPIEEGQTVTAGMSITMDITELKTRERELRRRNRQLEQVASFISHDLRNPLNVASGRVELARETDDASHLDAVVDAHGRMVRLIEDVLALVRQDQVTETEMVDLAAAAEHAWAGVDTGTASVSTVEGDPILADEGQLMRLLENLFRNAVQHGDESVTVTVGHTEGGFYVADDGPGIPANRRGRVFEAGHTDHEEGTGLGLAIVANVAEAHGWEFRVAESEDGGARFEFDDVARAGTPPA